MTSPRCCGIPRPGRRRWTAWRPWWGRTARPCLPASRSRGFLLAAPLALKLGCGFVMLRKRGKLPGDVVGLSYALEYGEDRIEIQADAVEPGARS